MRFHWFLPSNGDGRFVANVVAKEGVSRAQVTRPASVEYLGQVARAAEQAGFYGALTPTGAGCEDAWVLTSMLTQVTERLSFIVAFRPGFILPTLAAHQARTFQRLSGGRLVVNIVTGGDPHEQKAFGDQLGHDQRYARTAEFLEVFRRTFEPGPFDYAGAHYQVEQADFAAAGAPAPRPEIFFGGASPAGEAVAAAHADVHLSWGEPVAALVERRDRLQALARAAGRSLRFGVRLHVISRDTAEQAWAEADRLLAGMDETLIRQAQQRFARMESVGQARMTELNGGTRDGLVIAPNLWAGVGLVREGAGTALVGSHDEVAARLAEYVDAGFEELILSGWPHAEEAYRVGEEVLPRVPEHLADQPPARLQVASR